MGVSLLTNTVRIFPRSAVLRALRRVVLLLLIVPLPPDSFGQTRQYKFSRLTIDDGLSSYRVYDLAQDSMGFLWIGTREGLNRYDGYGFTIYRHQEDDSASLSDDIVRSVLVDRQGVLWVGTQKGVLNRFDHATGTFTRFSPDPSRPFSISGGQITSLLEDHSGTIWIGTIGGGLNRMDPEEKGAQGRFRHYRNEPLDNTPLSSNVVFALYEDPEQSLWIGTDQGLSVLDRRRETFAHYKHAASDPFSLSHNRVRAVHQDRSGILWVATEGGGLNSMDRSTGRFTKYKHDPGNVGSISHNDLSCLYEDIDGSLWIGAADNDGGVNRFDRNTGSFQRHKHDPRDNNSLLHDYVRAIRVDRNGTVWIVTDRGLSSMNRRSSHFIHSTLNLTTVSSQYVGALYASAPPTFRSPPTPEAGDLWVGTEDGLLRIRPEQKGTTHYRHMTGSPSSMSPGLVLAILGDRRGHLWVSTTSGGIDRLDPRTDRFVHYHFSAGTQVSYIQTIMEDEGGDLWLGTLNAGIIRLNPLTGHTIRYRHSPTDTLSVSSDIILACLRDRRGDLWVGTQDAGLNRLEGGSGRFKRFRQSASDTGSLPHNQVPALYEDEAGTLWVSTGAGLCRFERATERFELFLPPDGSAIGVIARILGDRSGFLWLSTFQNGLFRFDPRDGSFQQFDIRDGLQSNRFSYAAFQKANGEILLGGENGLTMFHPDSIRLNRHPPPVVLTSFKIFDKPGRFGAPLTALRKIVLAYNQNFFSFEFAALDFTIPSKNRYAYRLEGLDPGWVYPGERRAIYTNVDPGEYVLQVKAANNDGIWNEQGIAIPLTITPPFWATWWFRAVVALTLIGILAALYNYRVSKLLEMERMRVRIASDLHDDIGSSLSSIALITEMVRKKLPEDVQEGKQLMDVTHAARHTADALKDIVWIINPEHDKLDDIVLRMKDSAARLLVGKEYTFDCDGQAMNGILDMEFRRNVLLIYKETLNNIAKHARASRVTISVRQKERLLDLRISDNGSGFDEATISRGHGLENLRRRAEKIGGTVTILSEPGKGTVVHLTAAIP